MRAVKRCGMIYLELTPAELGVLIAALRLYLKRNTPGAGDERWVAHLLRDLPSTRGTK